MALAETRSEWRPQDMSRRSLRKFVFVAVLPLPLFQLSGCIGDLLFRIAGVAVLDAFVSPLVGDNCTLINQSGC